MQIEVVNPVTYPDWDDHVFELKTSTIFHTAAWAKILNDTYNYIPRYVIIKSNSKLIFVLPIMEIRSFITGIRGVSLPFTDFCYPCLSKNLPEENMLGEIISLGKKREWESLEFRGNHSFFDKENISLSYYSHKLELTDTDNLFKNFKSNTRRNIKKAEKSGITISFDQSPSFMDSYYKLNCSTRKKHGLPPQPLKFFRNVFKNIISNNDGIIISAIFKNKIIASAIYFHYKDQVIYKYGASDLNHLPLRANNLIMWEAIKHYAQKGFKTFDFGKTEISNEGLRRFKSGWGSQEKIINYYKYDFKSCTFVTVQGKETGWYNYLFKKMPRPLLIAAGKMLYRHFG